MLSISFLIRTHNISRIVPIKVMNNIEKIKPIYYLLKSNTFLLIINLILAIRFQTLIKIRNINVCTIIQTFELEIQMFD